MWWGCSVHSLKTKKEAEAGGLGPALGLSALPSQEPCLLREGKKFFLCPNPTGQTDCFYIPKLTLLYSFIHLIFIKYF